MRAWNVQKHPYRHLPKFDGCIAFLEKLLISSVIQITSILMVTPSEVAPNTRSCKFGEAFTWREVAGGAPPTKAYVVQFADPRLLTSDLYLWGRFRTAVTVRRDLTCDRYPIVGR